MAAAADRTTPCRHPEAARFLVSYPVATGVTIYKGTLVMILAGYANPAADTAGGIVVGVAEEHVANAGADGAVRILVGSANAWFLANSGIVAADVGKIAYVSDDQTVSDATGTNGVVAGVIEELETGGVWVNVPSTNALALSGVAAGIVGETAAAVGVKQHAIVAGDITVGYYDFTFPFTVAAFGATYRSATGVPLDGVTDAATINAGNVRISLAGTGAPALIATDVVAVVASA
jgi:hypothetical protein